MMLKLMGPLMVENLRHYPVEIVEDLSTLLAEGALAIPDPRRRGFYDVQDGDRTYYIHVSPGGKVLLLATWVKEGANAPAPSSSLEARFCACRM